MKKKALIIASVAGHINIFHIPYIKLLKEMGYEVDVATKRSNEVEMADNNFEICFERSPLKFNNIKAYIQLKKVIKENNYSIIHCHTPMAGVIARLVANKSRKNGTKVIYTAHGFHFYKGAPLNNWLIYYPIEKWLSKYTDCLITINQEDYELAKKKFKKCKQIELVHGVGLDTTKFDVEITEEELENLRNEIGIGKENIVLAYVAELNKNKNQILLIETIQELIKDNENYRLLLVGDGNKKQEYEQYVKEHNLEKYVKFLGKRNDVAQLLMLTNVYLASSLREGLPVNILEAMYTGLPIIATDNRGHRELIKDGENGYIIHEIGNKNIFANKIKKILEDKNIRKNFEKNSKEYVKKYQLEKVIEEMKMIYDNKTEDGKIKVLYIIGSMNMGGAENFIMNIYRKIDKSKIQIDFLSHGKGVFDEEIIKNGSNIFYIEPIQKVGPLRYKRELKEFFYNHEEYKIVHSHIDQLSGLILKVAAKCNIPVKIAHSHSSKNSNNILIKIYKKYLQSKINKYSDYKFACSEKAGKWLYKNKKFKVINNGLEVEKFKYNQQIREKIRRKLEIDDKMVVVGHVGRFSKVKNHTFLIDIFNEYYTNINNNSKLLFIGSGNLEEQMKQKVKNLNLEKSVIFTGEVNNVYEYYNAMDVFVFPSLYEGLPLTLIEAQINGLTCYASNNITNEASLTNNLKWCSLKESAKQWAQNLFDFNKNRNINTEEIRKKYDSSNIADEIQHIYEKLFTKEVKNNK